MKIKQYDYYKPFVIQIWRKGRKRFFNKYKNGRVITAWSILAAEIFMDRCEDFYKIKTILSNKKIKFQKAYIDLSFVCQPEEFYFDEIEKPVVERVVSSQDLEDLPF